MPAVDYRLPARPVEKKDDFSPAGPDAAAASDHGASCPQATISVPEAE